ncbi:MAG TPA: hypothetical protein VNS10_07670, partial [Gemmatimonadaceae bacterium]|nr:hypothetical protein [Gemmatimonadaceae bacterium]
LGDGNYGGRYQRPDAEMLALWEVAVDETRSLLTGAWGEATNQPSRRAAEPPSRRVAESPS